MKTRRIFKPSDSRSGDGMLTTVWGPSFWHVLHTMSFNYPVKPTQEDKVNYKSFVLNLQNVLPCKYCRINLTKNFKIVPLLAKHLENRDAFSRKNWRRSGKKTENREMLFTWRSTSAWAKSVLKVKSRMVVGLTAHLISPPILKASWFEFPISVPSVL